MIEANPRASRTLPFVAKATGLPLAKMATRLMVGATLEDLRVEGVFTGQGFTASEVFEKHSTEPRWGRTREQSPRDS